MATDEKPTMHVETEWFSVSVTDKQSAEAALPLVQEVFSDYLGKAPTVEGNSKPPRTRIETECPHCEYQWTFNGHYPKTATCPDCQSHVNAVANEVEDDGN